MQRLRRRFLVRRPGYRRRVNARQPAAFWVAVAAAGATAVGALAPWRATVLVRQPGIEYGDGLAVLGLAVFAGLMLGLWAYRPRGSRAPLALAATAGAVSCVVVAVAYREIERLGEVPPVLGGPAWGIYLAGAGGAVLALSSALIGFRARAPRRQPLRPSPA